MADAYTSTATVPALVKAAYDRHMRLALRSIPQYRAFADTRPTNQTNPGSTVVFHIYSDLAAVTATIDEVTDPEIKQIPDPTPVTVTLGEYGNYAVLTKRLQAFSLDGAIDQNAANMIAFNQATSVDGLVQTELANCTKVITEEGGVLTAASNAITSVTATDTFKAKHVRYAVTKLRAANVVPARGELYATVLHPEAAHDLRVETGSTGWRTPHEYVNTENIFAGEIGTFEGATFIETPRALNSQRGSGSGGTQTRVYDTYVFGKEALAEAVAIEPGMVIGGTVVDPLNRKTAMGWHGILGWKLFRPEALRKIQTSSSVRPNA